MNKETGIIGGIAVVILGAVIAFFALSSNQPVAGGGVDRTVIERADAYRSGATSGKVTLVEFGDFQCPACGAAYPLIKTLQANHSTDLTFVFRNFPLKELHKNAELAAQAAAAAGKQSKFWEMHDKLYENQDAWSESNTAADIFTAYAKDLGLKTDQFKTDLAGADSVNVIDRDIADGNTVSINATPTLFFNGVKYNGNLSQSDLEKAYSEASK